MLYAEGFFPKERPQKSVARALTYATVMRGIGPATFFRGDHVVLGGEGGDIDFLRGLGVHPSNILVAETQGRVLRRLLPKKDQCRLIGGDVRDLLRRHRRPLASVNLDLCGTLCLANLVVVVEALRLLRRGTSFAVTFSASRENCEYTKPIIHNERLRLEQNRFVEADFVNPFSRANAAETILYSKAGARRLRAVAYKGVGPSTNGNIIVRSMATLIGRIGVCDFVRHPFITVSESSRDIIQQELKYLERNINQGGTS